MSWSFLRVNKLFIIRGDLMKYWIWLASVEGLGPVKKFALLNKFETAKRIYNATEKEILKVDGMSDKIVQNMQKAKESSDIRKHRFVPKMDTSTRAMKSMKDKERERERRNWNQRLRNGEYDDYEDYEDDNRMYGDRHEMDRYGGDWRPPFGERRGRSALTGRYVRR